MRTAVLALGLLGPGTVQASGGDAGGTLLPLGKVAVGPISPVFGDPDRPRRGDVLRVGRFALRMGEGRPPELATDEEGETLFRRTTGQAAVPVAVTVKERYWNGVREGREDPLSTMDAHQLRQLQGVRFEVWDAEAATALDRLDLSRVCVMIEVRERTPARPSLPSGLRCLRILGAFETRDLAHLSKLEWLEWLDFQGGVESALDLAPLAGLASLRWLRVWGGGAMRHVEALGRLPRLRWLDLRSTGGLADLSFVSRLSALEVLDVASVGVADLGPLGRLPALRRVEASRTLATRLPTGPCSALRELNVLSTAVSDEAVAAFRRAHPQVAVWRHWNETLRTVLAGADGLRVRTQRIDGRVLDFAVAYEEEDRATIERVIGWLEVQEPDDWWYCSCMGSPWLEFTRGGQSLATLSFHHGRSIRWREGSPGWPGDAALEPRNAAAMVEWLATHGVTGPRDEIEHSRRRREEENRKTERMTSGMSQRAKDAFLEARTGWVSFTPSTAVGADGDPDPTKAEASAQPPHPFAVALLEEQPDEGRRIVMLLAMLGTDNGSWSQHEWQEQLVQDLLSAYGEEPLQSAAETALRGADRRARRGAARLWTAAGSRLANWHPAGEAALRGVVLDVMMQARYVPLRQRAAELLVSWRERVGDAEAERRLRLLLRDPKPAVRSRAMLVAGQQRWAAFEQDLLRVLAGETLGLQPLPAVPPEEELSATDAREAAASGEVEVAALALGYLGSGKARPALARMAESNDSAAARVALALLGEGGRLQPDDFRTEEGGDEELSHAAVAAVARFRGRLGLPAFLEAARSKDRWEEREAVAAIRAIVLKNDPPGREQVKTARRAADLEAWYSTHGEDYVRRVSPLEPSVEARSD